MSAESTVCLYCLVSLQATKVFLPIDPKPCHHPSIIRLYTISELQNMVDVDPVG